MRPGCDRPAEARLSFDAVTCRVWLDAMPERLGPTQEICELHAGRLTVPRGWMLCDRREGAADAATDPVLAPHAAEPAVTRPAATRPAAVEPAVAEPAATEDPDVAPDVDDVPDELNPSSPLLARAFRSAGPQRSVLTQRPEDITP